MLKKTIKYSDFDGNEREEDFYFNLTKAEIAEMEMAVNGGYSAMLNRIVSEQDGPTIAETFKQFILASYGEKSADGREFNKSEEITKRFTSTEAYSELYMELITDAKAAADFVNGVLPKDMGDAAAKVQASSSVK